MPVIGVPFSCGYGRPQIRYIGIIRGLAQRNNARKTSYFYGSADPHGRREKLSSRHCKTRFLVGNAGVRR
jgi:hypothetical protein